MGWVKLLSGSIELYIQRIPGIHLMEGHCAAWDIKSPVKNSTAAKPNGFRVPTYVIN